ncbi:hypothetical protein M422DRAFT_30544 [Sphaerobolus stellatus SS14]|uniref:Unplaced genomic scaffold SPHSTscaffold_44, whole genome shotgun sequence n=1 Tax=Sphaerobolus stellatus (strain SS14) TaxID=990650 RepID=A0A0C9ULR4_SPHS4|nr:hypothetical protein M422DRAFT_36599 [Sphaerobolus stellatus SS14]KIJ43953.1 hypothetical protein M422DRAFT_30544 [Sphaerobolus stellatus SS14]
MENHRRDRIWKGYAPYIRRVSVPTPTKNTYFFEFLRQFALYSLYPITPITAKSRTNLQRGKNRRFEASINIGNKLKQGDHEEP